MNLHVPAHGECWKNEGHVEAGPPLWPTSRSTVHHSKLIQIENCSLSALSAPMEGFERHYQVALTYSGIFKYCVGQKAWTIDPNRTLFMSPGWEFWEEHIVPDVGHAAILLNPSPELLDELCGARGSGVTTAFREASRQSTMGLRLLTHRLLQARAVSNELFMDEWAVHALREAMQSPPSGCVRASTIVDRAKEFLHARAGERLSLQEIASEVGVTAVYLTQEFARTEGIPLYRYQSHLRLSRALLLLPSCADITGLALDLGFSSHSHFTAVFRGVFGITPSAFRASTSASQQNVRDSSGFLSQTKEAA